MSQTFTDILESDTLTASRSVINGNVRTVRSCQSGTSFPSTDLDPGMLCFRTDESKLYQLLSTGPSVWILIFDLTKTYLSKETADTTYVTKYDANRPLIGLPVTDDATGARTLRASYDSTNAAYKIRGFNANTDSYATLVDKALLALDSNKLGGQSPAYYLDAGNLNAGTVPAARLPTNAVGARTVSIAAPSGGAEGDIWYQY